MWHLTSGNAILQVSIGTPHEQRVRQARDARASKVHTRDGGGLQWEKNVSHVAQKPMEAGNVSNHAPRAKHANLSREGVDGKVRKKYWQVTGRPP